MTCNDTTCQDRIETVDMKATSNITKHDIFDYYEYMHYDYEADPDNVPIEELIPVSIVYGLTLVIGLIGNTLVIVSVAKFKKMQNVTNMFLLSLASADLLLVCVCVPVKVGHFLIYLYHALARRGLLYCRDLPQ